MNENDFKIIKRRKGKNKYVEGNQSQTFSPSKTETFISKEKITRQILSAEEDILSSAFYKKFVQNLIEETGHLHIVDIVCYGIGSFSESVSSRYQLAFLLALKNNFKALTYIYDPVINSVELEVIKSVGCVSIELNEEGKREVNQTTLFFLPHCPKQLVNNLLWKNWRTSLSKCIILGNSFEKIVDSHSDRYLEENLNFVLKASSFVTEIKIDNCFKFSDIFNDLSIHVFLKENIEKLPNSTLYLNEEPFYQSDSIEFVTHSLQNSLNIS